MTTTKADDVVVACSADGPLNFGGGAITLSNPPGAALGRFDKNGAHLWSTKIQNINATIYDLKVDASGRIAGTLLKDTAGTIGTLPVPANARLFLMGR